MLYNNESSERAHKSVDQAGDSETDVTGEHEGGHFVSFVESEGKLWKLEESRGSSRERGLLSADKYVLSPRALEISIMGIVKMNVDEGREHPEFSCVALARKP